MWSIASTLCSDCGSSQTRYNPSKSSTYQKDGRPWSIQYGDGSSSSGILGIDTVELGGLTIKKQTIELAKTESDTFASGEIDGLLGLAFDSITTVRGVKTPVDNLISQGLISSPIFGVFLGKASNGGGGGKGYKKEFVVHELIPSLSRIYLWWIRLIQDQGRIDYRPCRQLSRLLGYHC